MHKLIDYICDELEELEHKAEKNKLSMTELQYVDLLAHAKKNLLTADAMMEAEGYSGDYSYGRGRTGNVKRDAMGRYSREEAKEDMIMRLHDMERNAHDDDSRRMIKRWIRQAEEQ